MGWGVAGVTMGNAGQFHEGLVLFAIFTAIGLGFLFLDRWYRRALAAKGRWPTVEGTIISASLKKVLRGTGVYGPYTHVPEVRNQYVVDGQRYEGNRVGYGDWGISDAAEARKLLNQYPPGSTALVHYDRAKPRVAVLQTPKATGCTFPLILAVILLFFGAISLAGAIFSLAGGHG